MDISNLNKQELGQKLSQAYYELSNRGLVKSARWAADACVGLNIDVDTVSPPTLALKTMQAKAYFDCKEYMRCWHALGGATALPNLDSTGRFLRLFARYHGGEAIKEDEMGTDIFFDKSKQDEHSKTPINPHLDEIAQELRTILQSSENQDPHLQYLYGIICRAKRDTESAIEVLSQSCVLWPWNWGCWLELKACFVKLVDTRKILTELAQKFSTESSDRSVMLVIFRCFASEELDPSISEELLTKVLMPLFPSSYNLLTQLARIHNGEGQFETASKIFENVLSADPFNLEDLDLYSNLLYVTEQRSKLAYLAQHVAAIDKYRCESCCIIANYYSLLGEHERAVQLYKRAIVLNHNYISAWTLMGHEFIELGNPHAAIETYRIAIELASNDFRPWFGLGQAYEVLSMFNFAQYYFQRTLALRPADVRLWDALSNCYEHLKKDQDAINALQQAHHISDGDVYYSYRLGMLYDRIGDVEEAVKYITTCANTETEHKIDGFGGNLANSSIQGNSALTSSLGNNSMTDASGMSLGSITSPANLLNVNDNQTSEWPNRARLWLAKLAMSKMQWSEALSWARRIHDGTREMLDEARALEREARENSGSVRM